MNETNYLEATIEINGENCKVIAHKSGKSWQASGDCQGKPVIGVRASSAKKAFENWENRARMASDF